MRAGSNLCRRIQQAVERANLSVEELAGRIGCSRALIYQYLSGTTLAQPDRLQQIDVTRQPIDVAFQIQEDRYHDVAYLQAKILDLRLAVSG